MRLLKSVRILHCSGHYTAIGLLLVLMAFGCAEEGKAPSDSGRLDDFVVVEEANRGPGQSSDGKSDKEGTANNNNQKDNGEGGEGSKNPEGESEEEVKEPAEPTADDLINQGWVGGKCKEDSDCRSYKGRPGICIKDYINGGMCTFDCNKYSWSSDGACPKPEAEKSAEQTNSLCHLFKNDLKEGWCRPVCDETKFPKNKGCRTGYVCKEGMKGRLGSVKLCVPSDSIWN